MVWRGLGRFFSYLVGKVPELQDMEVKDLLLAKVVLDIHRKRRAKEFRFVPLWELHPVHAIDHGPAMAATEARTEVLREHAGEIRRLGRLDRESLARYLPSISWFKVVRQGEGSYIAYEGNGRLAALQAVFDRSDGLLVEVEIYSFSNQEKMVRRLNRVRRMNGLID